MRAPDRRELSLHLATVALAGPWSQSALTRRFVSSLRPRATWLAPLAAALIARYEAAQALALDVPTLAGVLRHHPILRAGFESGEIPRPQGFAPRRGTTLPIAAAMPVLPTEQALADWLEVTPGELLWLADPWSQERRRADGPQRHYRYRWLPREYGPDRLIEMPRRRLRDLQRQVHRELLRKVPVHECAHGFVGGRSAITHARRHVGAAWVVRVDLAQFFCHVTWPRVVGGFRLLGYGDEVSRRLADLCTNGVPTPVLFAAPHGAPPFELRRRFGAPHLPQGAPTSPAIANLVAHTLDLRLAALAARMGATYSRYADDLTFSSPRWSRAAAARCARTVTEIAADCGFPVNPRKTLIMGAQQAQVVTGIVVNRHLNIARRDIDRLKAIVHEAATRGPAHANREGHADFRAHLRGRIAHVAAVNPARGEALMRGFARIVWD